MAVGEGIRAGIVFGCWMTCKARGIPWEQISSPFIAFREPSEPSLPAVVPTDCSTTDTPAPLVLDSPESVPRPASPPVVAFNQPLTPVPASVPAFRLPLLLPSPPPSPTIEKAEEFSPIPVPRFSTKAEDFSLAPVHVARLSVKAEDFSPVVPVPRLSTKAEDFSLAPVHVAGLSAKAEDFSHVPAPRLPVKLVAKAEDNTPYPMAPSNPLDPTVPAEISHGEVYLTRPFVLDPCRIKIIELVQVFAPHFEGNEAEGNWKSRQDTVIFLRRLTVSSAPQRYNAAYIAVIRGLLQEGIIKAVMSLRTTLSTNGIRLVVEAVEKAGSDLDPIVESVIHPLIKQCGNTKHQTASEANIAVIAVLTKTTYTPRYMQHVSNTMEEKNKGLRGFAIGWLEAILAKYHNSKHLLEEKGGADTVQKIVHKGLTDADATVRGKAEAAYWSCSAIWPSRADIMMESLPPAKQKSLLAHQGNPNHPSLNGKASERSTSKGNTVTRAPTATGNRTDRPSIRDHINAKKKALEKPEPAPELIPEQSLESTPSTTEQRPKSAGSTTGGAGPTKAVRPATRPIPTRPKTAAATASSSIGTLSSAPKRPLVALRKATNITGPKNVAITYTNETARDVVSNAGPKQGTSTNDMNTTNTVDQKRGRPLTIIANPPESHSKIPSMASSRSVSPTGSPTRKPTEVSGVTAEPELTSGFVRVLKGLVSDQSCQVPNDAFEVLAKALKSGDVSTRREGVDLGVCLYKRYGHSLFEMVPVLESSERDLLMYFIAKRKS
ncbi:MAG: hypothetical protein LQ340_002231 [Diploschistes diacapsis]|nr:MAG: hypothetical protein LQ340_002231 [Diploschistes diacapsis]